MRGLNAPFVSARAFAADAAVATDEEQWAKVHAVVDTDEGKRSIAQLQKVMADIREQVAQEAKVSGWGVRGRHKHSQGFRAQSKLQRAVDLAHTTRRPRVGGWPRRYTRLFKPPGAGEGCGSQRRRGAMTEGGRGMEDGGRF